MTYREFSEDLVRKAGEAIRATHGRVIEVLQKGDDPRNDITATDTEVNALMIEAIRAAYPEHSIYSEEGGNEAQASEYLWTIDPIDGTSNFARSIPHFAVCVGLLKSGMSIAGAVFNPVTNELFSFDEMEVLLNGEPVRASAATDPQKAQVLFHAGRNRALWDWGAASFRSLLENTKKVKDLGASGLDLCFLAAGRTDAVIYGTLTTHDVAAAIGMVRAAGGDVYTPHGDPVALTATPQPIIATATRELFDAIISSLHLDLLPR